MAIANSDGSIILSTKVDTSGINKGMSQMQGKATSLTKTFSKLGAAIASAFAIQKIIQFSNEAGQLATQTEASVQRLVDIYGSASDSVGDFIDTNARALGMSKAAAASFSSVYGNLFSVWADQATNAELTNRYLNMTAVVASKTGRTVEDVQERVRSGLLGNTEAIEDLGIFVNVKTIEMTDAFQRMANGKSWEQLDAYTQQQIRSMAILEQSTAKYGDEVADTSATMRNRYKAAYEDFQNSWGNIVNTVLLPVLETLTQIFDIVTKGLNALSGRSGQILENVKLQEENTDKTAENIKKQADNQKALNKEMKKTLAGFDDIQILSSQSVKTTNTDNDETIPIGGGSEPDGSAYTNEVNSTLLSIMGVVGVALAALGCILLFSGHVAWGLGFIIAGAGMLSVTMATLGSDTISQQVKDSLSNALIVAGIIAIILGILLCGAHMWGKGISLIALGAISIGGTVALNWDGIKNQIQGKFGKWLIVGGLIALVLGMLLLFGAQWGLGLGLILLGAGSIVTKVVVDWNNIKNIILTNVNNTLKVLEDNAGFLVILGILLCFAQMWSLGIAALVAGAGFLIKKVVINWDSIVNALRGPIGKITALVSASLLVIGILVCFVNLPLGIALIAAGAVGLVTVTALNWNSIVDWVKGAWNAVKGFWNKSIAPVFTAKWWKDLAIKCGNGLIAGFEGAINGIIWAFESMINWVVDGLNQISINIPDWVPGIGGQKWGVNIPRATLDRVSIPRLAQGAVIPPNREFLAILGDQKQGTNIETPLATMVEAFQMALDSRVGYSGGNTEVVLEIDGREFGRAVVEQGDRENRRIGTRLVVV